MKMLPILLLLLAQALAGQAQDTVSLPYGATLTMRRTAFKPAGQRMVYASASGLAMNGQLVYGTDGEPPRYQLASASLLLHGVRYQLSVRRMYNPWFGAKPQPRLFQLIRQSQGYLLWAMFSDGAGGYTARWRISGNTAKRILLSTDEQYCF